MSSISISKSNHSVSVSNTDQLSFLQSTAMFLLSYQFCWLFSQLSTILVARFIGIKGSLFFNEIRFGNEGSAIHENGTNIVPISLAGPLSMLLLYILVSIFLKSCLFKKSILLRTFLLWSYFHSMILFMGVLVSGVLTGEGIDTALNWLHLDGMEKCGVMVVAVILMVILSLNIVQFLPKIGSRNYWFNERHNYILKKLVFPSFAGCIFLSLFSYSSMPAQHANIFYYNLLNIFLVFLLATLTLYKQRVFPYRMEQIVMAENKRVTHWWMIAAIVLSALLRIVLSYGVSF